MERKTTNKTGFVFSDYLPAIAMAVIVIGLWTVAAALGMNANLTASAWVAAALCLLSLPVIGAEHYDTFIDGVFSIGRGFAAVIGLAYLLDGTMVPAGYVIPIMVDLKAAAMLATPWMVLVLWSASSVLAFRRIRSRKALAKVREQAEETLRHSQRVMAECRAALNRTDEIGNTGKDGSARVA